MTGRYDASGSVEGQFQPGSECQVLLNKLGIIDPDEMDDVELVLLEDLQENLIDEIKADQPIAVKDLCAWHLLWLGSVYKWAGEFHSVNMKKDEYPFATANQIAILMQEFENKYLITCTPCEGYSEPQLIEALAICHIELIIIHPFRDGNGRLSRVLATIMALQADMPLLASKSASL